MASHNGRCNCGSITVSLAANPEKVMLCHCLNCRRAGGLCSLNYMLEEKDITVKDTKGSLRIYMDSDTKTGGVLKRHFCSTCGSPVYSTGEHLPNILFVKASLFDEVTPTKSEVFVDRKIDWS